MPRSRTVPPLGCACGTPNCPTFSFCHCGCGRKTTIAVLTCLSEKRYAGKPCRYITGHYHRDRTGITDTGEFKIDGKPCRLIYLSRGQYAIIDSSNYERFTAHKYHAMHEKNTKFFYAMRTEKREGKSKAIYMHREVLGLEHGDPREGDHIEPMATTLNTIDNLRAVSSSENKWNIRGWAKSGFKWAYYHKRTGKYHSRIHVNHVCYDLGCFDTAKEAHDKAATLARKLQGEFSRPDHGKRTK